MHAFEAVLEAAERGPGCGIRLPFDPKAALGSARAPVLVSINDSEVFRTRVAVYSAVAWVGLRKDQLASLHVGPGDSVTVRIEIDREPRQVELPTELAEALAGAPEAAAFFDALSFTHRKEYAQWVGEGKKEQTRMSRAAQAVTMLSRRSRTPQEAGLDRASG